MTHTVRDEFAHAINGVAGRMFAAHAWPQNPSQFSTQTWISEARPVSGWGENAKLRVRMRFDDNCKNGKASFAVTGDVFRLARYGREVDLGGGCVHDDIARVFPELESLIKWHLMDSTGPMHGAANAIYHAGNRDHNGKVKGEPTHFATRIQFGAFPITWPQSRGPKFSAFIKWLRDSSDHSALDVVRIERAGKPGEYQYGPKYTLTGFERAWHECPFDTESDAREFLTALQSYAVQFLDVPTAWSEGKERDFDAARRAALWPEATDSELMQSPEKLQAIFDERLPRLVSEFRDAVESAGFLWETGFKA